MLRAATRNKRIPNAVIERKTKKKKLHETTQSFNQTSVFSTLEPSSANLVAKVMQVEPELIVKISSMACPANNDRSFKVQFRNTVDIFSEKDKNARSHFKRYLDDSHKSSEPQLCVGDTIELEAALTNYEEDVLYPWNYKILRSRVTEGTNKLILPEIPCSIITHRETGEDNEIETSYHIAAAPRAEGETITSVVDNFPRLREYLGYKSDMVNGFLLRGKKSPDAKVLSGVSCFRTREDDAENRTDNQVLVNFLKNTSSIYLNAISEENPWTIIPIYMIPVQSAIKARVESLANRYDHLCTSQNRALDMSFSYCNLVLDFNAKSSKGSVSHFNISRKKPLTLSCSLPERAKESKILVNT